MPRTPSIGQQQYGRGARWYQGTLTSAGLGTLTPTRHRQVYCKVWDVRKVGLQEHRIVGVYCPNPPCFETYHVDVVSACVFLERVPVSNQEEVDGLFNAHFGKGALHQGAQTPPRKRRRMAS